MIVAKPKKRSAKKEMVYITIRGSVAIKYGQNPHIYLTDFNHDGPQPILTFNSPGAVAAWLKEKIKEKSHE